MAGGETVRVERDGPVTVVTIDRPERRNAVDAPTAAALADAFRGFDRDPVGHRAVGPAGARGHGQRAPPRPGDAGLWRDGHRCRTLRHWSGPWRPPGSPKPGS